MKKKCEKCNQEWEVGFISITQTYYELSWHKGKSGVEKTLCQTCYQQDQKEYLRDWEVIIEYDKDRNNESYKKNKIKGGFLSKCYAEKVDEIEEKVLLQEDCYHCNPWKVEPEQRKRMKKLQENRKDLHWEEKRELEALEKRYNENQKNPKQREAKIQQLQTRITELEAVTNRTSEQEQELKDKKKELAELEKNTNSSSDFWQKYKGWIIGGGVVLVLLIILGVIFGGKKKRRYY